MSREVLIQEDYLNDPWKMMVCCICLNQTNNKQVRHILDILFAIIPDPNSAIICSKEMISECLKSTGLQNIKADRIKKMSQKWVDGFSDPSELPGIGKYGQDSWDIFINGNLERSTNDKKLGTYLSSIQAELFYSP
jgi:methyl-CpG-binding domain protein 4